MSLIGDSTDNVPVNLSLPQNVVERLHYNAKYDSNKRKYMDGCPVSPSIQYNGDELSDDEVQLVEDYIGYQLYDSVQRQYWQD